MLKLVEALHAKKGAGAEFEAALGRVTAKVNEKLAKTKPAIEKVKNTTCHVVYTRATPATATKGLEALAAHATRVCAIDVRKLIEDGLKAEAA